MTNLIFAVMGNADQHGRLTHLADFERATDAVAFARTTYGGVAIPNVKQGGEIHYTDLAVMRRELRAAGRR